MFETLTTLSSDVTLAEAYAQYARACADSIDDLADAILNNGVVASKHFRADSLVCLPHFQGSVSELVTAISNEDDVSESLLSEIAATRQSLIAEWAYALSTLKSDNVADQLSVFRDYVREEYSDAYEDLSGALSMAANSIREKVGVAQHVIKTLTTSGLQSGADSGKPFGESEAVLYTGVTPATGFTLHTSGNQVTAAIVNGFQVACRGTITAISGLLRGAWSLVKLGAEKLYQVTVNPVDYAWLEGQGNYTFESVYGSFTKLYSNTPDAATFQEHPWDGFYLADKMKSGDIHIETVFADTWSCLKDPVWGSSILKDTSDPEEVIYKVLDSLDKNNIVHPAGGNWDAVIQGRYNFSEFFGIHINDVPEDCKRILDIIGSMWNDAEYTASITNVAWNYHSSSKLSYKYVVDRSMDFFSAANQFMDALFSTYTVLDMIKPKAINFQTLSCMEGNGDANWDAVTVFGEVARLKQSNQLYPNENATESDIFVGMYVAGILHKILIDATEIECKTEVFPDSLPVTMSIPTSKSNITNGEFFELAKGFMTPWWTSSWPYDLKITPGALGISWFLRYFFRIYKDEVIYPFVPYAKGSMAWGPSSFRIKPDSEHIDAYNNFVTTAVIAVATIAAAAWAVPKAVRYVRNLNLQQSAMSRRIGDKLLDGSVTEEDLATYNGLSRKCRFFKTLFAGRISSSIANTDPEQSVASITSHILSRSSFSQIFGSLASVIQQSDQNKDDLINAVGASTTDINKSINDMSSRVPSIEPVEDGINEVQSDVQGVSENVNILNTNVEIMANNIIKHITDSINSLKSHQDAAAEDINKSIDDVRLIIVK